MRTHLTDEQIRSFRDRSVSGADLLRVSSHIADCEVCRARIASQEELGTEISRLRSAMRACAAVPLHTNYEDLAALVDGQLDDSDAEVVARHARECEACAADIERLRALKQSLENPRAAERSRWLDGFWPFMLGWKRGLALATSVGVALAVVIVVLGPWRWHGAPRRQDSEHALAQATIRDGGRVLTLTADGAVAGLEPLSPADLAAVHQALAARAIEAPDAITQLGGKRGLLLGSAGATPPPLELLAPLTTVVESERPVFRWTALAGAQYQVSVYDASYTRVEASRWIQESQWQVSRPLRRGERYSWQVEVRHDEALVMAGGAERTRAQSGRRTGRFIVPAPPMPEARFQVLDAAGEERISTMRSKWADSHLVLGVTYARMGLLDDAARQLRKLDEENPGSAATAGLRDSIERLRPANPGPHPPQ